MKKLILLLCAFLFTLGFYESAAAIPYTLTDTTTFDSQGTNAPEDLVAYGGSSVSRLEGIGDYVTWQHQYTFSPPLGTITSAALEIALFDDETDRFWRSNSYELGFLYDESGHWAIGEVDTGTYGYNLNGSYLADGSFYVTIASLWGDFSIKSSTLTINYDSAGSPAPVPEPASLLLLGTGLIGIAALTRVKLIH